MIRHTKYKSSVPIAFQILTIANTTSFKSREPRANFDRETMICKDLDKQNHFLHQGCGLYDYWTGPLDVTKTNKICKMFPLCGHGNRTSAWNFYGLFNFESNKLVCVQYK